MSPETPAARTWRTMAELAARAPLLVPPTLESEARPAEHQEQPVTWEPWTEAPAARREP